MTHAWLIIAHNEWGVLQRLVTMLDAPECAFFVHIDKKVKELPELHVTQGKLFMLEDRVDVRWGSVSQIQCELTLFEAAVAEGHHDYYHIISGTTLPLKSLSQVDVFFASNAGKNCFSGLGKDIQYQETLKVRRYNLFLRGYASRRPFFRQTSQFLWKSAIAMQRLLGIETNRGKSFFKASNWVSLTEEAVQYLLSRKKEILDTYRFSFCGDEFFVPSELMDSPLAHTVVNEENYLLHKISRSNADTYRLDDYDKLCQSPYLFARKFTER